MVGSSAQPRAMPLAHLPPILAAPLLVGSDPRGARLALILTAAGLIPVALASRLPDIARASGWPWCLRQHVDVLRVVASCAYALFLAALVGDGATALDDAVGAAVGMTLTGAAATFILWPAEAHGRTIGGVRELVVVGTARRVATVLAATAVPTWAWHGAVPAALCWLAAGAAILLDLTCRRDVQVKVPARAEDHPHNARSV